MTAAQSRPRPPPPAPHSLPTPHALLPPSSAPSLLLPAQIPSLCLRWRLPLVPVLLASLLAWHILFTFLFSVPLKRTLSPSPSRSSSTPSSSSSCASTSTSPSATLTLHSYLPHFRSACASRTRRPLCRELTSHAETCVYEGLICLRRRYLTPQSHYETIVDVVDDKRRDMSEMPSDHWCHLRHVSSTPRYYGSRTWPPPNDTAVPQHSCMAGRYRTVRSLVSELERSGESVTMIPDHGSIAMLDVDVNGNDHNAHFALDTLWLLDAALADERVAGHDDDRTNSEGRQKAGEEEGFKRLLTRRKTDNDKLVYVISQTRKAFDRQTARDLNRFIYATILRKDPFKLYDDNETSLHTPATIDERRYAKQLHDAYPELTHQLRLFPPQAPSPANETVCTRRFTAGFKTGFGAPEPVCTHIRREAYRLFGVPRPDVVRAGQVEFARPRKSILVINRHYTRMIANVDRVVERLRMKLNGTEGLTDVDVELVDTSALYSTEEIVRAFAHPGVVISPHGGQNQGLMFMQRHSALIELMPVGYTDYTFSLLAEPCQIWYFEFPASIPKNSSKKYEDACGRHSPHLLDPCNEVKPWDMHVDVDRLFPVVVQALEHIGHDTGTWISHHTV